MNQRLWNSSLNILFSVLLLILAAILASGAVRSARLAQASEAGQLNCAKIVATDSMELDSFYLREI